MHYGYLLRGTLTGLWKVGISGNISKRLYNYRTHVPERIVLESEKVFVSWQEAYTWERCLLEYFHKNRSIHHGEWINASFDEIAQVWNPAKEGIVVEMQSGKVIFMAQTIHNGIEVVRVITFEDEDTTRAFLLASRLIHQSLGYLPSDGKEALEDLLRRHNFDNLKTAVASLSR